MMNNLSLDVSVIMPMKNAEPYVYDAINSVLKQSFKNFELIVVDDGSTDTSREIAESFLDVRVKVIAGPKTGAAGAFNIALNIAKGKYIANCDADDLYPEDRLAWQVSYLEVNKACDAVCGTYSTMDSNGVVISQFNCGKEPDNISHELVTGKTRTSFCTFLTRREVLLGVEGCRGFFVTSQDIDLQLRIGECHNVCYEPRNSYFYRLHDSSITHTQAKNRRVFFEETARLFLQQRLENGADDLQRGEPPNIPAFEGLPSSSQEQIRGMLTSEAWRLHSAGHKMKAINKGWSVCLKAPFGLISWRNLLALIVKS
ncbi:MAG: glycosyltransferase family A protein [Colwellia sp.]